MKSTLLLLSFILGLSSMPAGAQYPSPSETLNPKDLKIIGLEAPGANSLLVLYRNEPLLAKSEMTGASRFDTIAQLSQRYGQLIDEAVAQDKDILFDRFAADAGQMLRIGK